jgi:putative ABC transport system ATP-binding protein
VSEFKKMSLSEAVVVTSLFYTWPGKQTPTLSIEEFRIAHGESVLLRGPSGSGKSTLLSAIASVIDIPPGGISVAGTDVGSLKGGAKDQFRSDHIGLIFQIFNLLPWLSALDNVLLPLRFSAKRRSRVGANPERTATYLLEELGLGHQDVISAPAMSLSIGQQQRVAAARALIGAPEIVLADEPTSALDEEAKTSFIALLKRECATANASLLFVSHDRTLQPHFDRTIEFADINKVNRLC